jgi:pimeloyl-ACP methyl ester carboxylesterase
MRALEKAFRQVDYHTLNIGYPSCRLNLEQLAEYAHAKIENAPRAEKIHFVGYSMGCLLTRVYLARFRPQNLGRVVMLAPPNQGSEVADLLRNFWPYRVGYGPAGQQLTTNQSAISSLLGSVDYELGVIAGNRPIDPVCSFVIGKENDGKVSVESTRVQGMKEHVVIPSSHTFIMQNRRAIALAVEFIKNGRF